MSIGKNMKITATCGLVALVLTASSGCTPTNKVIKMPGECNSGNVLSAGYDGHGHEWISCKKPDGDVVIYKRHPDATGGWYNTEIKR